MSKHIQINRQILLTAMISLSLSACSRLEIAAPQNRHVLDEKILINQLGVGESYVVLTSSIDLAPTPCGSGGLARFEHYSSGVLDRSEGIIFFNSNLYTGQKNDMSQNGRPSYIHIFKVPAGDKNYQVGDLLLGNTREYKVRYNYITLTPNKINYLGHMHVSTSLDCKNAQTVFTNKNRDDIKLLVERYGVDEKSVVINIPKPTHE